MDRELDVDARGGGLAGEQELEPEVELGVEAVHGVAHVRERAGQLRLRRHPDETRLYRTSDPVAFLGFVLR